MQGKEQTRPSRSLPSFLPHLPLFSRAHIMQMCVQGRSWPAQLDVSSMCSFGGVLWSHPASLYPCPLLQCPKCLKSQKTRNTKFLHCIPLIFGPIFNLLGHLSERHAAVPAGTEEDWSQEVKGLSGGLQVSVTCPTTSWQSSGSQDQVSWSGPTPPPHIHGTEAC